MLIKEQFLKFLFTLSSRSLSLSFLFIVLVAFSSVWPFCGPLLTCVYHDAQFEMRQLATEDLS